MDTAQLAIVVSGAVGLGAPSITALFTHLRENRQAGREQAAKNLDDLRELLDDLLPMMFTHTSVLIRHELWMRDRTVTPSDPGPAPPPLDDSRRQLYTANVRLIIRRGREDRLTRALRQYLRLVDEGQAEIGKVWDTNDVFDQSDEQLAHRSSTYWDAYEAFADECTEVVGAETD